MTGLDFGNIVETAAQATEVKRMLRSISWM
jgi:hypothetical protein